jgi:murein L,D-transpeptidase YcbB/YkuD
VDLARPIPVLFLYGTAIATESGRILFFDDIYGHDRRLAELLRAKHR